MITDARLRKFRRQVVQGERLLRELERRRQREQKANDLYYRLKVVLLRRKWQLKTLEGHPSH